MDAVLIKLLLNSSLKDGIYTGMGYDHRNYYNERREYFCISDP
uniref:Uncharacterized protein n=1 Tax=Arundo donax TaxID=35708 RepID=A0A0A9A3N7_ARUDO